MSLRSSSRVRVPSRFDLTRPHSLLQTITSTLASLLLAPLLRRLSGPPTLPARHAHRRKPPPLQLSASAGPSLHESALPCFYACSDNETSPTPLRPSPLSDFLSLSRPRRRSRPSRASSRLPLPRAIRSPFLSLSRRTSSPRSSPTSAFPTAAPRTASFLRASTAASTFPATRSSALVRRVSGSVSLWP